MIAQKRPSSDRLFNFSFFCGRGGGGSLFAFVFFSLFSCPSVRMSRYRSVLLLALLHQSSLIRANVSKVAPLSTPDDSLPVASDANTRRNLTELFVGDTENGFSGDTSPSSDIENADDQRHWDLDRLLVIWNPIAVSRVWTNETYRDARVSMPCGQDLTRYMTGISRGELWAQKGECKRDRIARSPRNLTR